MPSNPKNSTLNYQKNNKNSTKPTNNSKSTKKCTKHNIKLSKCTNSKPIPWNKKLNKNGINSKLTTKTKSTFSKKESHKINQLTLMTVESKSVIFYSFLGNLMTNEKAKINSSRLSINRGTPKSIEKEDPTHLTLKRKILYRTNDPDEELK